MDQIQIDQITTDVQAALVESINRIINFLPQLLAGLVILVIGWLVAALLRNLTKNGLRSMDAEGWLGQMGIKDKKRQESWITLLAQLVFWTVMVVFLIPTFEAWNLAELNVILNQLFGYLPNVFAAIVIAFAGYIVSTLVSKLIEAAAKGYGKQIASILAGIARWSIIIFTGLIVMTQLRIAPGLMQILFSAVMYGLALALGLAFGLGGKEPAQRFLDTMFKQPKKMK